MSVSLPPVVNELKNAALDYAKSSWKIFPLAPGGKEPLFKKSADGSPAGHHQATSDVNQITAWWDVYPNANIGLACAASGVIVVDIDSYKPNCKWSEFTANKTVPDTLTHRSARGGTHLIFSAPDGESFAGEVCKGVEIKHNGYIVVAPSVYQGQSYQWVNNMPTAPVPDWLPRKADRATASNAPAVIGDEDVQELLSHIHPDDDGYDGWYKLLMAIHSATGGSETGLQIADQWSQRGGKYVAGEVHAKWRSFDAEQTGGITVGTLIEAARMSGAPGAAVAGHVKATMLFGPSLSEADTGSIAAEWKVRHDAAVAARQAEAIAAASPEALQIMSDIKYRVRSVLPDGWQGDPAVDVEIIDAMINGVFWSGKQSKFLFLNEHQALVEFLNGSGWKFMCKQFGKPASANQVLEQYHADTNDLETGGTPQAREKIIKSLHAAITGPILDHIQLINQRKSVEWVVDMFAEKPRMIMKENNVKIVLTHKPFEVSHGAMNDAVVQDFKQHFPLLDDVLGMIVASRFAIDRKKAYLWLWCSSDWGKGFFMSVLNDLGALVEMSVKEFEGLFEGRPVGRTPEEFKRCLVLAVDEFKAVKSELKQLQNTMPITPKNELRSTVEIFTKMFFSAENVASLVGDHGVEDQFANRMSMIRGEGTLDARPMRNGDRALYFAAVKAYVAGKLNALIEQYQALGPVGATKAADQYLQQFHGYHGLGQHFTRLSESMEDLADEFGEWVMKTGSPVEITRREDGARYLKNAATAFDKWLDETCDRSQRITLKRRQDDVFRALSEDGRGNASHQVNRKQFKAIKLAPGPDQPCMLLPKI